MPTSGGHGHRARPPLRVRGQWFQSRSLTINNLKLVALARFLKLFARSATRLEQYVNRSLECFR